MSYKFIDLFCGIGGFRIALENLGCECVFSSEIDDCAKEMYYQNFGDFPYGDITKINKENIPDFDILCAGFPCQPFSVAGKRKGFEDTRGTLFFEIADILRVKQPKMFILENVKGLVTHNKGNTMKTILNGLEYLGYKVSYGIFNASDFGVPQSRERLIIVGHKYKTIDLSKVEKHRINSMEQFLLNEYCIDDILNMNDYTLIPKEKVRKQKSGLVFCGYLNKNKRIKGVLPNTEHLSRVHRQCNRIYSSDGLCPTITSGETTGRYYIYDEKNKIVRKLSLKEIYRFMGFPIDFKLIGKKTQLYKKIGNSVCVGMIEKIAKLLIGIDI